MSDLRLLVNEGPGPDERYVSAGVPWFATLFGRDSIISAFQALAFRPQIAVETLQVLADHQATEDDPARCRTGQDPPRATDRRDGTLRGAAAHAVLRLGRLDAAVADPARRHVRLDRRPGDGRSAMAECARGAGWIDRYGDRDGDGFVEYERRTDRGLLNQGWKDSHDAIRDREGRRSEPPIALAEVQGYVYDAKRRMARLAAMRGETELSMRLDAEADQLATRFEQAFWMEDRRYYAMALDRDKHQADAIASNAGHCLWSGIVRPTGRATSSTGSCGPRCSPDGVSARSPSDQPGYNPIGYHTGTVWPHDTSLIAAGFKRYGFHDATNRLVGQMMEAAQDFADYRLPELFCGFDRTDAEHAGPIPGRLLAAGVGGRIVIPVPRDDARTARARRPTRARTASPAPARLARQGDADRSAHRGRVGRPAVPPLAGHDQRRGPAQGRRRRRHHPTLIAPA